MIVEEIDTFDRIMNIHTTIIQFHPFIQNRIVHSFLSIHLIQWTLIHYWIHLHFFTMIIHFNISSFNEINRLYIHIHNHKWLSNPYWFTIIHFNHKYHWLHPFISFHTYINAYRFQYDHHPFISNTLFILHNKITHLNR